MIHCGIWKWFKESFTRSLVGFFDEATKNLFSVIVITFSSMHVSSNTHVQHYKNTAVWIINTITKYKICLRCVFSVFFLCTHILNINACCLSSRMWMCGCWSERDNTMSTHNILIHLQYNFLTFRSGGVNKNERTKREKNESAQVIQIQKWLRPTRIWLTLKLSRLFRKFW